MLCGDILGKQLIKLLNENATATAIATAVTATTAAAAAAAAAVTAVKRKTDNYAAAKFMARCQF